MKDYIGTKIVKAEPAYRCMDGRGNAVITTRPKAFRVIHGRQEMHPGQKEGT